LVALLERSSRGEETWKARLALSRGLHQLEFARHRQRQCEHQRARHVSTHLFDHQFSWRCGDDDTHGRGAASTTPSATTQPATSVTSTGATLNATINPNSAATTYYFQFGLTTNYGSFSSSNSLPTANTSISTNRAITGLSPGTLYHFRVVATNSVGVAQGGGLNFHDRANHCAEPQ